MTATRCGRRRAPHPEPAWVPTTHSFASDEDLVIRCELTGVEPDDVELALPRGVLLIRGERRPLRRAGTSPGTVQPDGA